MQTSITPVAVYPSSANTLYIRAGNLGPPPTYYYQLQNVTITSPAKAAVAEVKDADGNIVTPAVAAQDAVVVVTVLKDGNVNMTDAQWSAWPAGLGPDGDSDYQLTAIATNLGLTRA